QKYRSTQPNQHLAVVPMHSGDAYKALAAIDHRPTGCSPATLEHASLVLFYTGGDNISRLLVDSVDLVTRKCFAETKLVVARVARQEDIHPTGPSVQFDTLFLDERAKVSFAEFDAVAFVEWYMKVADPPPFERLYHAAFGNPLVPFWGKGSSFHGTSFNTTAMIRDLWHILGYITTNTLYNTSDPDLTEYVNYMLLRWSCTHSNDDALWATMVDLPYNRPLWHQF
ncbi:unnamed protein product, partial [Discosporangium mesarthrocarpum]